MIVYIVHVNTSAAKLVSGRLACLDTRRRSWIPMKVIEQMFLQQMTVDEIVRVFRCQTVAR
jgi:hypothetical protein